MWVKQFHKPSPKSPCLGVVWLPFPVMGGLWHCFTHITVIIFNQWYCNNQSNHNAKQSIINHIAIISPSQKNKTNRFIPTTHPRCSRGLVLATRAGQRRKARGSALSFTSMTFQEISYIYIYVFFYLFLCV